MKSEHYNLESLEDLILGHIAKERERESKKYLSSIAVARRLQLPMVGRFLKNTRR